MADISLVSINIERSKHLDTVIPFLKKLQPEIATIQECMERDIPVLEETLQAKCFYTPLCEYKKRFDEPAGVSGQGIFSIYPFSKTDEHYYFGSRDPLYHFGDDIEEEIAQVARALSVVECIKSGTPFRFATTHFTWSVHGDATERQLQDMSNLLSILEKLPDFILSGDFNAPRGRATWDMLAAKYKDNIPERYTSSIDPMHRAGELPYVVDGIFSTPKYEVKNVTMHSGISDHKAVTATISTALK
jgi:hypothetical protein